MTAIDVINGIVDDILTTIDDNRALLGNPVFIYEKIEDPAILAEDHMLPVIHVLPLAEGIDNIRVTMGDGESFHHDFSVTILGTYDTEGINEDLREIREYGYNCAELFRGASSNVGEGHVYHMTLKFGAMVIIDKILQQFVLTLNIKAYD